jgi:N-methylhydantoinase A
VGADVGGTFIDVIAVDELTGEIYAEKQPATPDRLADELLEAIGRLPGGVEAVSELLHGSTVATNALVQRRGAQVGLLTTVGFRDVLELGRGNRPFIYDWVWNPPTPLVARARRREIAERIGPGGEVLTPLDLDDVDRETEALIADGVEAIAIAFLHSYANPDHERAAAARIAEGHPNMPVTISSDVAAEWREFERTSTAVINAHLQPVFGGYIADVGRRIAPSGAALSIMASNGGLMGVDRATALPVRTLASGPAGGVIGCSSLARALGHANVICADVGGTTFDVSIVEGGEIQERNLTEVDGRPILGPSVDVVSVGAGGGSIAYIDDAAGLRVGPVSAGAQPGPACFGLGGTEPTVTDAHVVLGLLDPEAFLGSRMPLKVGAAEEAIRSRIADPLGMEVETAAAGIVTIAQSTMAAAIHTMTVERGSDPRDFAMFAFGGGGGLFAAPIAAELSVPTIVVPRGASTLSAWGIAGAPYREDASVTRIERLDDDGVRAALAEASDLERPVTARIERARLGGPVVIERSADVRYLGQEHTITVPLDAADDATSLASRFTQRHRRLYGHGAADAAAEIVAVRVRARVDRAALGWPPWTVTQAGEPRTQRDVWLPDRGSCVSTPIYDRDTLAVGQRVRGPAIVEEPTSTTVVPVGWTLWTEHAGHLVLQGGDDDDG